MKAHAQCEKLVNVCRCYEYHNSWSIKSIKSDTTNYRNYITTIGRTLYRSIYESSSCTIMRILHLRSVGANTTNVCVRNICQYKIVSTPLLEPGQLVPCFPILHSTYTGPVPFINHILQSISLLCCHLKPLNNGRGQFSGAGHCLSILLRQYQR